MSNSFLLSFLCSFIVLISSLSKANKASQDFPAEFITNPLQTDGFGSQFQNLIAAVIYAELNKKQFVYSPFQSMEHNYTHDPEFLARKERFINFITHFRLNEPRLKAQSNIPYKTFFDANIAACAQSNALQKIRRIFKENKNLTNFFQNINCNVAIHIRRPNPHDSRIDGADTPDKVFLTIINSLRKSYSAHKPLFHLFSQGKLENFRKYQAIDTVLHLNESIEDTFLGMVAADVLIVGASSFSYTAGLLSEGAVYYIPFWHAPLPHWKSIKTLEQ